MASCSRALLSAPAGRYVRQWNSNEHARIDCGLCFRAYRNYRSQKAPAMLAGVT